MGVKSALNNNPAITIVVVAAIAGAAVWIGVAGALPPKIKDEVYFSADDGKTWFADKSSTVTPYTKDGKEVVRAWVYKCKGGKPFVGVLSKQNPSIPADTNASSVGAYSMAAVEFKQPGESSWEAYGKMSEARKTKINAMCPDGGTPETVLP